MLRKGFLAAAGCALVAALSGAGPAFGAGNLCPTCDVIQTPRYVNVYWDVGSWEAGVAATAPDLTRRRIDQLVQALGHSLYFSGLAQYGVSSVSILPSITETGCGAPPADVAAARAAASAFARCLMTRHPELDPDRTMLNVFLPPSTARDPADPSCTQPGEHDKYGSPVEVAIVPLACNPSIGGLLATVSHLMVEGATDARPDSPFGWKTYGAPEQEIADECEDTPSRSVPFLFAQAASYWSNAANACVSGWTPGGSTLLAPIIMSGAACGTGKNMTITLTGTFGAAPWDLGGAPPQTRSLYVSAQIAGLWRAGNPADVPDDAVGFGDIRWLAGATSSGDTITLAGFDAGYGAPSAALRRGLVVLPGDAIDVSVSSPATGQTSLVRVIAPSPRAAALSVTGDGRHIFAGGEGRIVGRLSDGGGCAVDGAAVTVASGDATDTVTAVQAVSSDGGQFQALYAPRLAGRKTITLTAPVSAAATVAVYPRMTSLAPAIGGAAGNQAVTLTGDGFRPGTTIAFGGVPLPTAHVNVISRTTIQLTTPPSLLIGDGSGAVDVTATVAGVTSFPLAYTYVVPGKPVITFTSALCGVAQGSVAAYRADGTALPEAFALAAPSPVIVLPGAQRVRAQALPAGGPFAAAGGPITATVVGQPSLTTTAAVPLLPGWCPRGGASVPATYGESWDGRAGAFTPYVCATCGDGRQGQVVWQSPDADDPGTYFSVAGSRPSASASAAALARQPHVEALTADELRALVRASPLAGVGGAPRGTEAFFAGPAIRVSPAASSKTGDGQTPQRLASAAKAQVGLGLAAGHQAPASYRVVHLTATPGAPLWIDVTGPRAKEGQSGLAGAVTETGVYALVELRPRRAPAPPPRPAAPPTGKAR